MQAKRNKRFADVYELEKRNNLPLSKKELFVAGLFLYWGEGMKGVDRALGLYNTNPQMVKLGLFWYVNVLGIPKSAIKVHLHIYSDMNIKDEIKYWSTELKLPLSQFRKPYIKQSKKANISYKNGFGHGTCGLIYSNVSVKERVLAAIKAIADYYENRI